MHPSLKGTPVRGFHTEQTGGGVMVDYIITGNVAIVVTDDLVQLQSLAHYKGSDDPYDITAWMSENYEDGVMATINYGEIGADWIDYKPNFTANDESPLTFVRELAIVYIVDDNPSVVVTLKNGISLFISNALIRIAFKEKGGWVQDLGRYLTGDKVAS